MLADAGASLNSWVPLWLTIGGFVAIVVALAVVGRAGADRDDALGALGWIPNGLERVTGLPAWITGMVGTAAFGLLVAGIGFYNDVAWHVGKGRDKNLFTAPHTMIITGLGFIALGSAVGILFATLARLDTELRFKALRVPWSAVPLGLLGLCALGGFPLDDLWHRAYGIDVTMWSPTHMLMICGASFSLIAAWLALAEGGIAFRGGGVWPKVMHLLAAYFVLEGLLAPLGEFQFGVPQFQQVFHPLLLLLASAFTFVATRIVVGRWWSVGLAVAAFATTAGRADHFVTTRGPGFLIASAVAVELVALLVGTDRRLRFAVTSAIGVSTLGLAGEWLWNVHALQPWKASLLAPALILGGTAALGAAILGAAFGGAITRQPGRIAPSVVAVAAAGVVLAIALPLPRHVGVVEATIDITPSSDGTTATVVARLDPPEAANDNRWWQVLSWQGGGTHIAELHQTAPGTWVADSPAPIGGKWKTILRLQRGDELMAAPIYLPADPEIGAPEVPAVSRTVALTGEQALLMREVKPGPPTVQDIAYVLVALVAGIWAAAFVVACVRIPRRPPLRPEGSADDERGGRPQGREPADHRHDDAARDGGLVEVALARLGGRADQGDDVPDG